MTPVANAIDLNGESPRSPLKRLMAELALIQEDRDSEDEHQVVPAAENSDFGR